MISTEMLMTVQDSRQTPLFDVRSFRPKPFEVGSFYWMVESFSELLIFREDFPEADHTLGGKQAWCPVLKSKMVLIQRKEGWSDRRVVEAVKTDLRVKAALGLGVESDGPGQATLSRHRQRMEELGLDKIYLARFQQLLEVLELLTLDEPVCVDSVPVAGAGQVKDTYNLLGDGIRKGISALARRCNARPEETARALGLEEYLRRSVKGVAAIDWSKAAERREFLIQLVADAQKIRKAIAEGWTLPPSDDEPGPNSATQGPNVPLGKAPPTQTSDTQSGAQAEVIAQALGKILKDDIEFDVDGAVQGIRQKPGGGRHISLTDLDMCHGRKSKSQLIAGFKAQVVATALMGWILITKVIQANRHDGKDLVALIEEAENRGIWPSVWNGDHAYGTLDNHLHVHNLAQDKSRGPIELIANNARPPNGGCYTKDEFEIDWSKQRLTCPAGQSTGMHYANRHGERGWLFQFDDEKCAKCPFRSQCIDPKAKATKGRTVFMEPEKEKVLRRHLQRRQDPDYLKEQARRYQVEQSIAGLAQCGGKQAHRFGIDHVDFDVRMSALAFNLRKLGRMVRDNDALRAQIDRVVVVRGEGGDFIFLFFSVRVACYSPQRPLRYPDGFARTSKRVCSFIIALAIA
jgi:hypothetical protein